MAKRRSFLHYERLLLNSYRLGAREELGPDASEEEVEALAQRYYEGPQRKRDHDKERA